MAKGKYRLASKVFYILASTTHHTLNSDNTFDRLVWESTEDILGLRNVISLRFILRRLEERKEPFLQ